MKKTFGEYQVKKWGSIKLNLVDDTGKLSGLSVDLDRELDCADVEAVLESQPTVLFAWKKIQADLKKRHRRLLRIYESVYASTYVRNREYILTREKYAADTYVNSRTILDPKVERAQKEVDTIQEQLDYVEAFVRAIEARGYTSLQRAKAKDSESYIS